MSSSLISVFPDTHLGQGHHGLSVLASKAGKDTRKLLNGEFLLFLNKAQTAFKMYAANSVVVHYKSPANRRVDIRTIEYLPHCFNAGELNYSKALKLVLDKTLRGSREKKA